MPSFSCKTHADGSLSTFYADKLIRIWMYFYADVADRDTHQGICG